ncbi:MAG: flagellar hook assembly protein FlgD [Burkholderiales bacterium]|nr:flagellar hook assembly protein FlgD [Burkholderiales bacterium]
MEAVASATSSAKPAQAAGGDIDLTQDRFLKLLIAQMKSQDPLNPLDNAQITSQLAQLSTVTGINKLGDLISGLSSSFSEGQSLQAAGMIGRGVFTPGNTIALNGTALAGVELPQAVEDLIINIKDKAGVLVHSASLGPQSSGLVTLQWDGASDAGGQAPNGTYTFEVKAQAGGKPVVTDVNRLAYGLVNSVTLGAAGVQLNVEGIGATALSQVKQIL